MKVFLDTNIVIDLLDKRKDFYQNALAIFMKGYHKEIEIFVSPMTYATASFLLRKNANFKKLIANFRQITKVTVADENVIDETIHSDFVDFEDGLQYYSALTKNCEVIITRNLKDFTEATIPVLSPNDFLKTYKTI